MWVYGEVMGLIGKVCVLLGRCDFYWVDVGFPGRCGFYWVGERNIV